MRIFGLEIRSARRSPPLRYYRDYEEPRSRSATKRFTFGDVRVSIYSPFDDATGETLWRFSLLKQMGEDETGNQLFRRSFLLEDAQDLHRAVDRTVAFISRAREL